MDEVKLTALKEEIKQEIDRTFDIILNAPGVKQMRNNDDLKVIKNRDTHAMDDALILAEVIHENLKDLEEDFSDEGIDAASTPELTERLVKALSDADDALDEIWKIKK